MCRLLQRKFLNRQYDTEPTIYVAYSLRKVANAKTNFKFKKPNVPSIVQCTSEIKQLCLRHF